jgi:hypothetical protein
VATLVKFIGYALVTPGLVVLTKSYAEVFAKDGLSGARQLFNTFNLWSFSATIIPLALGLSFVWLAGKLER